MPFVNYVPIDRAAKMVRAVNEAKTEKEHRNAELRLEGYRQRCEELGQTWPCCELDLIFEEVDTNTNEFRPSCCGQFLDWQPIA